MATEVPLEVTEIIFENIDTMKALITCATVCQQWRIPAQTLLFHTLILDKPNTFPGLLSGLLRSNHLAASVKHVVVVPQPPLIWMHHKPTADIAGEILQLLAHPSSLTLSGPFTTYRVIWKMISYKMKEAIMHVIKFPGLVGLVIEGWEFEIGAEHFCHFIFASPSLKSLRLKNTTAKLRRSDLMVSQGHEGPTIPSNLDFLHLNIDEDETEWDSPLRTVSFTPGLNVHVTLGASFLVSGSKPGHYLSSTPFATMIQVLDLDCGHCSGSTIWDLKDFHKLRVLNIRFKFTYQEGWRPRMALQTLQTLTHSNVMETFSLAFIAVEETRAEDTVHLLQLIEVLSSGSFPALKTVNLLFTTVGSTPWSEGDLGVDRLRGAGMLVNFKPDHSS